MGKKERICCCVRVDGIECVRERVTPVSSLASDVSAGDYTATLILNTHTRERKA